MASLAAHVLLALVGQQGVESFPKVLEITPVQDNLICLHLDEGYVKHHVRGQKRSDDQVVAADLSAAADLPSTYTLTVAQDPQGAKPHFPAAVHRKSKGTSFAWWVDRFVNGRTENTRKDHAKEHWVYLTLPRPLKPGQVLTISAPKAIPSSPKLTFTFDPNKSRSESVHVNLLGWTPDSPNKIAYLFHWAGSLGPVSFKSREGKPFFVLDLATGKPAFQGTVAWHKGRDNQDTAHVQDSPPHGSFVKTDVWQMDFTPLQRPGKYVVSVPGVGTSFPFEIKKDVLRPAFYHTARALYHNRSGIALTAPYTEFTRPAPHNPKLTPGFQGKLQYTTVRMQEWGSEGGDAAALKAGFKGPLEAWGWYQDAGDWDSYHTHLRVATELLFAYMVSPQNFKDGDLNIPESGNKVPDILDEAAWLPRFCHRLRQELLAKKWGTGGIGLRVAGDAFGGDGEGRGSWDDVDRFWAVSGEDPLSTYRYAGAAAHLHLALQQAKAADPQGVDWLKEAKESYAWAKAHTRPSDVDELKSHRAYASAALFRATGDKAYENQLDADTSQFSATSIIWEPDSYGPMLHVFPGGPSSRSQALQDRLRGAVITTAIESGITTPGRRTLRYGGNLYFPMLVGQQTTPWALEAAVGWAILRESDPAKAAELRKGLVATADYFLGTNSQNMTWVTGVGPRYPAEIFHMDAWYNGKGKYHPGLIPYGIWRKQQDFGEGPWSQFWPYKTVYPKEVEAWPGAEQWFSNRCSPMGSEFTVHQNIGPAAAFYGILCDPS